MGFLSFAPDTSSFGEFMKKVLVGKNPTNAIETARPLFDSPSTALYDQLMENVKLKRKNNADSYRALTDYLQKCPQTEQQAKKALIDLLINAENGNRTADGYLMSKNETDPQTASYTILCRTVALHIPADQIASLVDSFEDTVAGLVNEIRKSKRLS